MGRFLAAVVGWLGALWLLVWRATLRIRVVDDPRPALREQGIGYAYAILHSQQLNFVLLSDDTPIAAMISASKDGDMLVPACRVRGVLPMRGSSRKNGKDKGGRAALAKMIACVEEKTPALFAVDGPRGPRGKVGWGVIDLARMTGAHIVIAGVFPARKRILERTWDRTQLPKLFTTLTGRFRPVVDPKDFPDREALRAHVTAELRALEEEWDPVEAEHGARLAEEQRIKFAARAREREARARAQEAANQADSAPPA